MDKKLQKYLESYKRLYFKGEIHNPKSRNLLEKKRISLELSEEEANNASQELYKGLTAVLDYINDFLDLNYDGSNESLVLDEFDKEEIEEFWRDMNLTDEDGKRCLEHAISEYINKSTNAEQKNNLLDAESKTVRYQESNTVQSAVVLKNKPLEVIESSETIENVYKEISVVNKEKDLVRVKIDFNNKDSILNEYRTIITRAKRNDLERVQIRFLNLLLSYSISYENEIFAITNREEITEERLKQIFYDCYADFLEEFMIYIKEEGFIDLDKIPEYNLDDLFCSKNIKNYLGFINQINEELNMGLADEFEWMPKAAVQYESIKANTIIGRKTANYIFRVINECKLERIFKNEELSKGFKTIDAILVQLITNLTNFALSNIKNFIDSNIQENIQTLENVIDGKEKAINYINAAKVVNKSKEYERYLSLIVDSLREYPYYEEAHLRMLEVLSSNINEDRVLLDVAYNFIVSAGETCLEISDKLISLNFELYKSSLEAIDRDNTEFIEIRQICDNLKKRFKINDVNTIVKCELSSFGQVISAIDYSEVSEDIRLQLYKKDLAALRERDFSIEEKSQCARNLRDTYKIVEDEIVIELEMNNFGMIFSDVDFLKVEYGIRKDMFKKKLEELEYERDQQLLEDKIIEYKEKYRIDTKYAMNLEISKFGRWFGELDLSDIEEEDLEGFIIKLSKTIMILNLTEEKKNILLNQLKEESGLSTNKFYAIQNKIGNAEMALNNEDSIELEFIEKSMELFEKYPSIMLEEKLLSKNDEDFLCGVFIKTFSRVRDKLRDEDLFLLRKRNNREGFLLTSKAIYHSNWTNAILLKDINKVIWREKSNLKNGQRYFRPYIFLATDLEEVKFDFVGFRQVDVFIKFLIDFINTYKLLLGKERCAYEKISIEAGTLSVEEMLEGNILIEKFTGSRRSIEDISSFINKEVSTELKKLIKIQDVKSKTDSKIKNAIAAYAPIESDEVPLVGFDSTLFKSGKEGFLLTSRAVYCKNKFGNPWVVKHKDMKFIKIENEYIIFNDKQTTISTIPEVQRQELRNILEFLSYTFKEL